MIRFKIVVFFLTTLLISCDSRKNTSEVDLKKEKIESFDSIKTENLDNQEINKKKQIVENRNNKLKFIFENDTIRQVLIVQNQTDTTLNFIITSLNKRDSLTSNIEGVAIKDAESDLEIFCCDDESNSFPLDKYFYENECELSILIDFMNKRKVKIIAFNCSKIYLTNAPYSSDDLMVLSD